MKIELKYDSSQGLGKRRLYFTTPDGTKVQRRYTRKEADFLSQALIDLGLHFEDRSRDEVCQEHNTPGPSWQHIAKVYPTVKWRELGFNGNDKLSGICRTALAAGFRVFIFETPDLVHQIYVEHTSGMLVTFFSDHTPDGVVAATPEKLGNGRFINCVKDFPFSTPLLGIERVCLEQEGSRLSFNGFDEYEIANRHAVYIQVIP